MCPLFGGSTIRGSTVHFHTMYTCTIATSDIYRFSIIICAGICYDITCTHVCNTAPLTANHTPKVPDLWVCLVYIGPTFSWYWFILVPIPDKG